MAVIGRPAAGPSPVVTRASRGGPGAFPLRRYVQEPLSERRDFVSSPQGVVLYGPTGTGKSLLVQALAGATGVNLVTLEGVKVFSRWLGESEEAVHDVFTTATQVAPSIIFLDQLDALAPVRAVGESARASERVVAQLQVELDRVALLKDVIVIGETNRLDSVDPAVLRAGRLGLHIPIGLPNEAERLAILRIQQRRFDLDDDAFDGGLAEVAAATAGFSGAELEQAVQEHRLSVAASGGGLESFQKLLARRNHSLEARRQAD